MRILRPSSEEEMIAVFLSQEYESRERYADVFDAALAAVGASAELVKSLDLDDDETAAKRRRLLAEYRGYGTGQPSSYLTGFPDHGVRWFWARITPAEALSVRYIRWEFWTVLSAGTRSATVAAQRIREGETAFGVANDNFWSLAKHLQSGSTVPPMIIVTADAREYVVLEGHTRLTAYALVPEALTPEVTVLVGSSPGIAGWCLY